MGRFAAVFPIILVLLLGGCAYKYQPIYNVDRAMPAGAERLSAEQMRDIIIHAGKTLEWSMEPLGPGHLEATQNPERYSATVDIYYTPTRLQILLKSTVNLRQTATTIHAHYNFWIRNLENQIMIELSAAAQPGAAK
jgi:hypothetical protein